MKPEPEQTVIWALGAGSSPVYRGDEGCNFRLMGAVHQRLYFPDEGLRSVKSK